MQVKAIYSMEPESEGQIELKEGDVLTVESQDKSGWWTGTNKRTGQTGMFPGNYVKIIDESTQLKNNSNRQFGRPDWAQEYETVRKYVLSVQKGNALKAPRVGIFLCGPPVVASQLKSQATKSSKRDTDGNKVQFIFHKENF